MRWSGAEEARVKQPIWRRFRMLVLAPLCVWLALLAFLFLAQRKLIFPGATGGELVAEAGGALWGERVTISTRDGEKLAALYVAPQEGAPVLLYFHGNADRIAHYGFLAEALAARGYGLLAPAFRGYPGSTGSPDEAGLFEDGRAAALWLAGQAPASPLVIGGWSLGTGVAAQTAAEGRPAGLVLLAPYDSIAAIVAGKFPWVPVKLLLRDEFRSDRRIGRVEAPKLLLHGGRDAAIPIARGEALFAAASEPKSFVRLEREGHWLWSAEATGRVVDFVGRASRGEVGAP